jgi:hypothetical protein
MDTNTNQEAAQNTAGEQQPTTEQLAARQMQEDYANLQQIAQHKEAAQVALSLKSVTPPEQTERHALYDRIINTGGPLIVAGAPVWKITEQKPEPAE